MEALRCALAQAFETVVLRPDGTFPAFNPRADMHLQDGEWHGTVTLPVQPRRTLSGSRVPL